MPVSAYAASMQPSKLGLMPGTELTVGEAILGLVVKSANDAAAALGELLGGDEARFAGMITLRARTLGMAHTTFANASGLPDPDQRTTARDMAALARRIVSDFPAYYSYFSTPSFVFHGRLILSHDRLLQAYPGADGLKTGYIEASGFNLVTSAVHSGVRLIGVVLGAGSSIERDLHMASLLDAGFEQLNVPAEAPIQVAQLVPNRAAGLIAASATGSAISVRQRRWERGGAHHILAGLASPASGLANRKAARFTAARRAGVEAEPRVLPAKLRGKTIWRAHVSRISAYQIRPACGAMPPRRVSCWRPQRG